MAWETYKGLEVPTNPTGDAGINLKDNFKTLADRALSSSAVPGGVLFVGGTTGDPDYDEDADNFYWDNVEKRIGLGTDTPLRTLQIEGSGSEQGLLMATGSTDSGSETYIYFGPGTSSTEEYQRIRYNQGSKDLLFDRKSTGGVWSNVMTIDWNDSRVGIGTESPLENLHVEGNGSGLLIGTGDSSGSSECFIYFGSGLSSTGQFQRIRFHLGSGDLFFGRKSTGGVWTDVLGLDYSEGRVNVMGAGGLLMWCDPADSSDDNQIVFGREATGAQYQRLYFKYSDSDLKFQRRPTAGAWTTVLHLDWQDSYVGVGHESPETLLDVDGAITLGEDTPGTPSSTGKAALYLDTSGGTTKLMVKFRDGSGNPVAKTIADNT